MFLWRNKKNIFLISGAMSKLSDTAQGITAFKFVIWGGKSGVLRLEISFYGDADNAVIPILMHVFIFSVEKCTICTKRQVL